MLEIKLMEVLAALRDRAEWWIKVSAAPSTFLHSYRFFSVVLVLGRHRTIGLTRVVRSGLHGVLVGIWSIGCDVGSAAGF